MAANIQDCVICGEDHPRCSRHNKMGLPCMRWPRDEESLCRVHGGESPSHKRAGVERRMAKALAADSQAVLGYSLDGKVPNVLEAMEGLTALSLNQVEALGQRVNDLLEVGYSSEHGIEQVRAAVTLYERALDRSMKHLEVLAKHQPDGEAAAAVNLLTSLADQIKGMEL